MSEKITIKELLKSVEVEWKPLGNIANVTIGEFVHKNKQNSAAKYPVYNGGIKPTGYYCEYNNLGNKIIVSARGANAGFVNKIFEPYWAGNSCYSISVKEEKELNWQYIFYYLKSNENKIIGSQQGGGGIPAISKKQMQAFLIPIPYPNDLNKSLNIQNEIVRILDNFTELTLELTSELTSELTARKKQYSYYRDKLLTFADGKVEFKTLGEVIQPTNNIRWRDTDEIYRYIDLTSVSRENNSIIETSEISAKNAPNRAQKIVLKNDVIFATTRPTQQRFCLITDEYSGEIASTGYCVLRAKTDEISPKWIFYHISSTNFKNYVEENQSGSAYPAISDSKVKEYQIPIPYANNPKKSLEEQERIVSILDKFDTLTNSISEGLPKEIKLRKQQYEYYRDLLLTFPKE